MLCVEQGLAERLQQLEVELAEERQLARALRDSMGANGSSQTQATRHNQRGEGIREETEVEAIGENTPAVAGQDQQQAQIYATGVIELKSWGREGTSTAAVSAGVGKGGTSG
jgi:hypothetical protein